MSSAAGHLERQVSILDVHVLGLEDVGEGIRGGIGGVVRVDLVCGSVQRVLVQELGDRQAGRREGRKVDREGLRSGERKNGSEEHEAHRERLEGD